MLYGVGKRYVVTVTGDQLKYKDTSLDVLLRGVGFQSANIRIHRDVEMRNATNANKEEKQKGDDKNSVNKDRGKRSKGKPGRRKKK